MQALTVFEDPNKRNDHYLVSCATRTCHWRGAGLSASYYHCPGCGRSVVPWPVPRYVEEDDR